MNRDQAQLCRCGRMPLSHRRLQYTRAGVDVTNATTSKILIVDDDEGVTQTLRPDAAPRGLSGPHRRQRRNRPASKPSRATRTPSSSTFGCRSSTASDFLRRLRAHDDQRDTPVAIVTGDYFLDDAVSTELRELGAELRFKPLVARRSRRPRPQPAQGDPLTESGSRFLKACRRQPVDATPVWFMRQAGRYMSEYRSLRERYSLLDICRTPDLATEVTLQPVRRIEVDAAILFSDLLLPLEPMGIPFDFIRGEGPAIENAAAQRGRPRARPAVRAARSARLRARRDSPDQARARPAACRSSVLPARRSRSPRTRSRAATRPAFAHTKALMCGAPAAWHRFCDTAARTSSATTSSRRSTPASTPCRCSTRGSAR